MDDLNIKEIIELAAEICPCKVNGEIINIEFIIQDIFGYKDIGVRINHIHIHHVVLWLSRLIDITGLSHDDFTILTPQYNHYG